MNEALEIINYLTNKIEPDENKLLSTVKQKCSNLGDGIFKINSILNHQIDPVFVNQATQKLYKILIKQYNLCNVTKIITAPISGIIPSFSLSMIINVPVVYGQHTKPVTFSKQHPIYESLYESHTKNKKYKLLISGEYLTEKDKVLIIDDVLASGKTAIAMMDLCKQANAQIIGAGFILEKQFEKGQQTIYKWCDKNNIKRFPIESAVVITNMENKVDGAVQYKQ